MELIMSKNKTLSDIWADIKPGDCVLFQKILATGKYEKPELVTIVGIDVWDLAMAVYYTDFKDFNPIRHQTEDDVISGPPKVHGFGEWMTGWKILGHWRTVPKFRRLLKAYRKHKPF